jgi:(E)-4-hydroxy-3-methylbut-2-enyl-diphosphate synthase
MTQKRHKTVGVKVGKIQVGGGAPVVVQSMTNTDTVDIASTTQQCFELAQAGSELVRITVNIPEAAAAVPEIKKRLLDAGCDVPLIGDFHYNGHVLLKKYPDCAAALDKYRINPGNVGHGQRRDEQFSTICSVAREHNKPVRIGVNGGSLNQELVMRKMQENTDRDLGKSSEEIINECMVLSALQSTELALECGLRKDQIIISCKVSRPHDLVEIYRDLAQKTDQPLHLGLTEAGMGAKGLVWSAASMGILLGEGIGDTVRISLTPRPGGDRREEVYAACELLQSLGLRTFAPSVTACPGCGRTHQYDVPGISGKYSGIHPRQNAGVEAPLRRCGRIEAGNYGLHRERPRRIESRQYRNQLARHRRVPALPRLHRRPAFHDAGR